MKLAGIFMAGWLILGFAGCSAVYVDRPMGDSPQPLEAQQWDGTWLHKDGSLTIEVRDARSGLLRVAWVEMSDEKPRCEVFEVSMRTSGGCQFGNIKDTDAEPERYFFGRIAKDDRLLLVWLPDAEKIAALVEAGKLPGRVDEQDVMLEGLAPEHVALLCSQKEGLLFDWENPVVLLRVAP